MRIHHRGTEGTEKTEEQRKKVPKGEPAGSIHLPPPVPPLFVSLFFSVFSVPLW
jgi:hypothetical protein